MDITIKIDCETINEFHAHLSELQKQIKRSAKKRKLNPLEDEFSPKDSDSLYDDNCYGTHIVKIKKTKI